MASGLMLYRDPECKKIETIWQPGAVAFFGQLTYLYNWGQIGGCIYWVGSIPTGQAVFSGGDIIYTYAVTQNLPYSNIEENADTLTENPQTVKINHRIFIGRNNEEEKSYLFSLECYPEAYPYQGYNFSFLSYTQNPWDGVRQTWSYTRLAEWISYPPLVQDNYNCVKIFRGSLENVEYYFLVFNIAADNTTSGNVFIVGIPRSFFDGSIPEGYAGNESESNEEEAYTPSSPYTDSIPSRDLTGKKNPYGFNNNNGLRIAVITFDQYAEILQGIYSGTAEGLLNKIAQGYYMITGGNDHRQADEIQSIVSAVLCCHLVPRITTYGTTPTVSMATIAGYHIFGQNLHGGVSMEIVPTNGTIFEYDTPLKLIEPRLNSFLDFEPYTSIVLHLPFMSSVSLSPSALYGNSLYCHYSIDIYTGVLSVDVKILDKSGRDYIITTQQANIKTEIPIMGNGANGAPLASIASSVLGVARSGSVEMAAAAGIVAGMDELSKGSTGVAVGKNTIEGIGSYLSPRSAYIVYTRPEPANPGSKAIPGLGRVGFLEMEGGTSHLSGKVGDFVGYSEFSEIRLDGFSATDDEKKAIEALLKGGVYV